MHKMLVRHQDLTTEKTVTITTNKDSEYIRVLTKDYEKQGFVVRFENLADLVHLD